VCRRCLAKQPRRRYASALELADDLRRCLNGSPVKARLVGGAGQGGRWLRRNARGVALFVLGVLTCWGVVALSRSSSPKTPTTAPATAYANRLQQEANQLRTWNSALQGRERQASYLHRIGLADRALRDAGRDACREQLDACPEHLRRWEWHHLYRCATDREPRAEFMGIANVTELAYVRNVATGCLAARGWAPTPGKGQEGGVEVWDPRRGAVTTAVRNPSGLVRGMALSPDGFRLALLLDDPRGPELRSVEVRTGRQLGSRYFPKVPLCGLSYSPDGTRLLLADAAAQVHLAWASNLTGLAPQAMDQAQPWVKYNGPHARAVAVTADAGRWVAVTPDGRRLLHNGGWPGPVPGELRGHTDVVLALAYNTTVQRLATAGRDRTVRVWNSTDGQSVELRGHRGAVTGVSWTADGTRLASCSDDGTVKVWDPAAGLEVLTLKGFEGGPSAVAFGPDGRHLAVAVEQRQLAAVGDDRGE
jgi:hypothetical protein